jgi:protein-tyrosine phosphatase
VTQPRDPAPAGFRLLFVCTANQCRSPMAQVLLHHALAERWGEHASAWTIESAGAQYGGAVPLHPLAAEALAGLGVPPVEFASRRLTPGMLRDADLVLTATRAHRGMAAQLEPRALNRLFTINQFAHLLRAADVVHAADPAAAGRTMIEHARAARSRVVARTDEDDLPDPIGRPLADFRRCAAVLRADVNAILRVLPPGFPAAGEN